MWVDEYVHEILIRQQIAEAERRAARHRLLPRLEHPRRRQSIWELVRWWLAGATSSRPTKRLEEGTSR